jgi:hypothetical protein
MSASVHYIERLILRMLPASVRSNFLNAFTGNINLKSYLLANLNPSTIERLKTV